MTFSPTEQQRSCGFFRYDTSSQGNNIGREGIRRDKIMMVGYYMIK